MTSWRAAGLGLGRCRVGGLLAAWRGAENLVADLRRREGEGRRARGWRCRPALGPSIGPLTSGPLPLAQARFPVYGHRRVSRDVATRWWTDECGKCLLVLRFEGLVCRVPRRNSKACHGSCATSQQVSLRRRGTRFATTRKEVVAFLICGTFGTANRM